MNRLKGGTKGAGKASIPFQGRLARSSSVVTNCSRIYWVPVEARYFPKQCLNLGIRISILRDWVCLSVWPPCRRRGIVAARRRPSSGLACRSGRLLAAVAASPPPVAWACLSVGPPCRRRRRLVAARRRLLLR